MTEYDPPSHPITRRSLGKGEQKQFLRRMHLDMHRTKRLRVEHERMIQAIQMVRSGEPAWWVLMGTPGMGKTMAITISKERREQ